ncbi:hypothetical protein [Streptomyces albireticuli]|nr:hypothetical protein [Streptomyces albireticuli]MCD9143887.1 hypothetical protein [Streptomyces albireticuli]MCD9161682.1 hypothetical protein [Streptomyces albireticuli]MCD9192004.1 hypothetical protein [Streptomyces albireticuli]
MNGTNGVSRDDEGPTGMTAGGYAPDGYAQNGHVPGGHVPDGHAQDAHAQSGHTPDGELARMRAEIEGLRSWRAELEDLVKRFAQGVKRDQGEVEEILSEILGRLDAVEAGPAGRAAPVVPAGSAAGPGGPAHLPWSLRASEAEWRELADWLDWLGRHYAPQLHLRIWPCWPAHGGVVEELAALHAAWRAAQEADADPARAGSELAYWHQMWLWPTVERIRQHYMFSECETEHAADRPGRPTDPAALEARVAEAAAERRRQENERYAFFAEVPEGFTAERPDGLWRRAGDDWEYLSLLDWAWHPADAELPPPPEETLREIPAERADALAADRQGWVTYWARHADENDWRAGEGPTTVVRRRRSPERLYDEAYGVRDGWAPTASVYAFLDARPSNPPHLVEIDVQEAERLLRSLRGVTGATEL